ncbi:unnamed protein product [Clonostachys rosea]|uniref:Transcription factor domain-containing protein n=1 Tax=Bionectria ochroleuca TaxID=29856 RepID=A0ABY6UV86_BIOOC|nr:unnamed protein product [Clonostachys rosea]
MAGLPEADAPRTEPASNASSSRPDTRRAKDPDTRRTLSPRELGDAAWAKPDFEDASFAPFLPPSGCFPSFQMPDYYPAAAIPSQLRFDSTAISFGEALPLHNSNGQDAFTSLGDGSDCPTSALLPCSLDPLPGSPTIYEFSGTNIAQWLDNAPKQLEPDLPPLDAIWNPGSSRAELEEASITDDNNMFRLFQEIDIPRDSPENIARIYDRRVCEVLCMYGGSNGNPWRKIVWPLAQEHPALYHAIAAMTYFQMSKFITEGVTHFRNSIQELAIGSNSSSMRLEVALVITLVLAFAQAWHYPRSSNGTRFTRRARPLVQRALATFSGLQTSESSTCLSFLANTWMYQDIITRITCTDAQEIDLDLMTSCSQLSLRNSSELPIDPLMGCAGTLFPLIGRVGDLVRRVRRARQAVNSPATVSYAAELKGSIEAWVPPIDLEVPFGQESPNLSTSDLVQTANVFKWSTILLLYQAVPELPRKLSFPEMAQKILVLVATVSLQSRALIFHVLPLMIAGCEVIDAEDKAWVRSRWKSMSNEMTSGIVERCLELTLEVWRRRESRANLCASCLNSTNGSTDDILPALTPGITNSQMGPGALRSDNGVRESFCQSCLAGNITGASEFFDFSTFATHTRPQMTSGHREYSVTSKDHWFSIMEEWGWEVMLG